MVDNNEILYMMAHITNKQLEYKWIKDFVEIPNYNDDSIIEFKIVVEQDGTELGLIFIHNGGIIKYTDHVGSIMESIYRGTGTEHIMFSDVLFEIDEFNFEAMKEGYSGEGEDYNGNK